MSVQHYQYTRVNIPVKIIHSAKRKEMSKFTLERKSMPKKGYMKVRIKKIRENIEANPRVGRF